MQQPAPHNPSETYPGFATFIAFLKQLSRRGGSLRIGALLRVSQLPCDDLCALLNDLAERRIIKVVWRCSPQAALPARLRYVERVTLTRFGRSRLPVPCVLHPPRLSRRRRHPRPRQSPHGNGISRGIHPRSRRRTAARRRGIRSQAP